MQWSQVVFIDNVGLEIWNYLYIVLYILTTRNVIGTLVYYEFQCTRQDKETMFTKNIIVYINTSCNVIRYVPMANVPQATRRTADGLPTENGMLSSPRLGYGSSWTVKQVQLHGTRGQ